MTSELRISTIESKRSRQQACYLLVAIFCSSSSSSSSRCFWERQYRNKVFKTRTRRTSGKSGTLFGFHLSFVILQARKRRNRRLQFVKAVKAGILVLKGMIVIFKPRSALLVQQIDKTERTSFSAWGSAWSSGRFVFCCMPTALQWASRRGRTRSFWLLCCSCRACDIVSHGLDPSFPSCEGPSSVHSIIHHRQFNG